MITELSVVLMGQLMTTVSYSAPVHGYRPIICQSHSIHANNEKDSVLIVKWEQRDQTTNSLNHLEVKQDQVTRKKQELPLTVLYTREL